MLYLKACRRCGGDVKFDKDLHGPYLLCLQCGMMVDSRVDKGVNRVGAGDKAA